MGCMNLGTSKVNCDPSFVLEYLLIKETQLNILQQTVTDKYQCGSMVTVKPIGKKQKTNYNKYWQKENKIKINK